MFRGMLVITESSQLKAIQPQHRGWCKNHQRVSFCWATGLRCRTNAQIHTIVDSCIHYVYGNNNKHGCILCFPTQTHTHAVDTEATHQPVRSLPLPALQSSSYRQAGSSDICNIYTHPVMLQITTVIFSVWGTKRQWNHKPETYI